MSSESKERFMADYGLSAYDAGVLVVEQETAAYFEEVATGRDAKHAANWVITNLFAVLKGGDPGAPYATLADAQAAGGRVIHIGEGRAA